MLIAAQATLASILFLLLFYCFKHALLSISAKSGVRARLTYHKEERLEDRLKAALSRYEWLHTHLTVLTESTAIRMKISTFCVTTMLLLLFGVSSGIFVFQSVKGIAVMSLMSAAIPYMLLRLSLVNRQMRTRLDFLPAVEIFYQSYLLTGSGNVRKALQHSLEENRMLYPMKSVFEQLARNLSTHRDEQLSFDIFIHSLGHVWADYFISIIRIAIHEGNDVSDNLKQLIVDMRKAQLANQAERNRMLEIRLANFSPILFLAVFLIINFRLSYETAYMYYVLDPNGRSMILDALLLIFVSFVMGLHLSRKRM